jgi:hypothetical protein
MRIEDEGKELSIVDEMPKFVSLKPKLKQGFQNLMK